MSVPNFINIEKIRTLKDYELTNREYTKCAKMSWDERLEHNVCPECMHRMFVEPEYRNKLICLEHGTKEQINMYKSIERKRKSKNRKGRM